MIFDHVLLGYVTVFSEKKDSSSSAQGNCGICRCIATVPPNKNLTPPQDGVGWCGVTPRSAHLSCIRTQRIGCIKQ